MKNSKQLCDITNDDRLSSLPWNVQRDIISFLPMLDVVRMTCVSKKWRSKFYSLPNLIFNYREFPLLERKLDRFVEFVSQMISVHDESEIDTFSICVDDYSYSCRLEWIQFALQHKVKSLVLCTKIGGTQILPSCLFVSESLQTLHLALFGQLLKLPTEITLTNLRELSLTTVFFDDVDLTHNFFSNCPVLEILTLHRCSLSNLKMLSISALKLKYLKISNCYRVNECKIDLLTPSLLDFLYDSDMAEEICLRNASSMYNASIIFQAPVTRVITNSQLSCAVKVLEGLCHVSHLQLSEWFTEVLFSKGHGPLKNLFASGFCGLETLKLHMWPAKDHVQKVISLLSMFRGLRELDILISSHHVWPSNMPILELNSQDIVDLVAFPNLEIVAVHDFGGEDCVLEVVEFILMKARVLKDMMILLRNKTDERERAIIYEKLAVFSTAFPNAPIFWDG